MDYKTYPRKTHGHAIGSQITTIEIDQTQTVDDGEETPVTTTTKDDEIRIHLGANSRPISFEYYTENQGTQQTTSATYYYHYDLHGNVIRVTNSSGTTVIQYTYDQLGTIVSETNANSIYNPFTYMGEAQVIHDDEFDTSGSTPKTGLFSSGSAYYNPETGTPLGGYAASICNSVSRRIESTVAQTTPPVDQRKIHCIWAINSSNYLDPFEFNVQRPSFTLANGIVNSGSQLVNINSSNDSSNTTNNSSPSGSRTQSINATSPCCDGGGEDLGIISPTPPGDDLWTWEDYLKWLEQIRNMYNFNGARRPLDAQGWIFWPKRRTEFTVPKHHCPAGVECSSDPGSQTLMSTRGVDCGISASPFEILDWLWTIGSPLRMRNGFISKNQYDPIFHVLPPGYARDYNPITMFKFNQTIKVSVFDKILEFADRMLKWITAPRHYELFIDYKVNGNRYDRASIIGVIAQRLWEFLKEKMRERGEEFWIDDSTGRILVINAKTQRAVANKFTVEDYIENIFQEDRSTDFSTGLDRVIMDELWDCGLVKRRFRTGVYWPSDCPPDGQ